METTLAPIEPVKHFEGDATGHMVSAMTLRFALLLLVIGTAAHAAAPLFSALEPGKTTLSTVREVFGPPNTNYPCYLPDGEIDPFVGSCASPEAINEAYERAAVKKRKVIKVRVLEYPVSEGSFKRVKLVFKDDTLYYAILPVSSSESTPMKLKALYGKEPRRSERPRRIGDTEQTAVLYAYPEKGLAFVQFSGYMDSKMVFAPVENIE